MGLKLRVNKYIKKLSFVRADLEWHREEHQKRLQTFLDASVEYLSGSELEYSHDKASKNMIDVYKKKPVVQTPDIQAQTKKLLKKISRETPPDVTKDAEKHAIFRKAFDAQKQGDWFTIYEISSDLGLEPVDFSEEHIEWIKFEIDKVVSIIKGIKTTLEWLYGEPNANKEQLLTTYCMATCVSNKKDE